MSEDLKHIVSFRVGYDEVVISKCGKYRIALNKAKERGEETIGYIIVEKNEMTIGIVDMITEKEVMVAEASVELPEPRPLRGPSYRSAVAYDAALRFTANLDLKSFTKDTLTFKNIKVSRTEETTCKTFDEEFVPRPIKFTLMKRGVERICMSPIYSSREEAIKEFPILAAAAARNIAKSLRPLCVSERFLVNIVSSPMGFMAIVERLEEEEKSVTEEEEGEFFGSLL